MAATSTADPSAPGYGLGTDQALTLRLTGLTHEAGEDRQGLLDKVNGVLKTMPCQVSVPDATHATRQGMPGSRPACAVILTFGSENERASVLRCKARLSRKEDTRTPGTKEGCDSQQPHHVRLMWKVCHQARRPRRMATIWGCSLTIDGKIWTGSEQGSPHCITQSQLHQAGSVPLPVHCHPPQQQMSCIGDPHAAMSVSIHPPQQPQPHSQTQYQPQSQPQHQSTQPSGPTIHSTPRP